MSIGTTFQAAKLSIFWHTQKVVTVIKISFSMCQIFTGKSELLFYFGLSVLRVVSVGLLVGSEPALVCT